MQLLHCTSTASSMQVQTPDSRTQRVFVSGALFGTVLAFFAGKTCDASLAAVPPSATIYFFYFLLTERVVCVAKVERRAASCAAVSAFLGIIEQCERSIARALHFF